MKKKIAEIKKKAVVWTDQNKEKLWLHVMINIVILGILLYFFRPVYETNDDMGISNLASGAKGVYNAHLIYSNYLLGLILNLLYRICHWIPWYALAQYAVLFCSFTAIIYVTVRRLKTMSALWVSVITVVFFSYECYIRLQYTKTAGAASAAGILLLLYALDQERISPLELAWGYLIACMGFMYRKEQFCAEALLMTGIALFLLLELFRLKRGQRLRRLGVYCAGAAGLLVLMAGLYAVDRSAYRSEEWQEYLSYNSVRTELFDYGFPPYSSNEEAYKELGINKNAFSLYRGWNYLDTEKFTTEVMEELASLKTPTELDQELVSEFQEEFPEGFFSVQSFGWCLMIFLFSLFWGRHRWSDLTVLAYEIVLAAALYFYLFYRGRYLYNRVDTGIWLAVLLVVLWTFRKGEQYFSNQVGLVFLLSLVCISQYTWRNNWRENTKEDAAAMEQMKAVIQTIHNDSDHLYLTKVGTVSFAKAYGVFESVPFAMEENLFALGGWPSNNPVTLALLEQHGVTNPYRDMIGNENIYLVDNNIELTMKYINKYYDEGARAELVSEIGGVNIYRVAASS